MLTMTAQGGSKREVGEHYREGTKVQPSTHLLLAQHRAIIFVQLSLSHSKILRRLQP